MSNLGLNTTIYDPIKKKKKKLFSLILNSNEMMTKLFCPENY
jgi:hypothetical protein